MAKVKVLKGFGKQEKGDIIDLPDLLVEKNIKLGRVEKVATKQKVKNKQTGTPNKDNIKTK